MEFRAFVIQAVCVIAESRGTIQYANIDDTVVLKCKVMKGAEDLRWRRNNFILTDGQKINKEIPWLRKSKIDIKTNKSQYNLLIANVTAADFGLYLCEMQISKEMSRQIVTLEYREETTLSYDVSIAGSSKATLSVSEFVETTSSVKVVVTENIQTTFPDKEIIVKDNYTTYVLFSAGFIVVLLISIGCNICISNYKQRAMQMAMAQQMKIQNPQSFDETIQESDSAGAISHVSSKYETINENNMTMPNFEHKIQSQTFNRTSSLVFNQSYLEVIGDDDYFASKEITVESSSMTNNKKNTFKPKEIFADNIDAEVASYHSILSKQFNETDMFVSANSSNHIDINSVNKDITRKVNSTKKREFVNPYSTLKTSEMQNYQNFYTAVKHDTEIVIQREKTCYEKMKRNSYP